MKARKQLRQSLGWNIEDWPRRYSNIQWARIVYGEIEGCTRCFPHGQETSSGHHTKDLGCWKRYRRTQWRDKEAS